MKSIRALDQNYMPFLTNNFSKIFEDLFYDHLIYLDEWNLSTEIGIPSDIVEVNFSYSEMKFYLFCVLGLNPKSARKSLSSLGRIETWFWPTELDSGVRRRRKFSTRRESIHTISTNFYFKIKFGRILMLYMKVVQVQKIRVQASHA